MPFSVEKLDENSGSRLFFYSTSSNSYDATIVPPFNTLDTVFVSRNQRECKA